MKLAQKLPILCVLLSIAPAAVVGYLAYENGRQTIVGETMEHLVSINIFKSNELKRWIEGNKSSLEELAQRPLVRQYVEILSGHDTGDSVYHRARESIVWEHLKQRLKYGGFFELFLMCPRHGLITVSTDERQEGKYRGTHPYYIEGKSRTYVQGVYYSPTLEQAAMTVGTPIKDRQGNLLGVLAGRLHLKELSTIISLQSGKNHTEDTYLVNVFNFFVTEPRFGESYALKKAVHTEGVSAGLSGEDGVSFYRDYRGAPVIGAYKWLPEYGMCIITEMDQAEAFAPIVFLARVIAGIVSAVSIAAGLLGLFFAHTIIRPVRQLVAGTEEIGTGNLEHRVGTASKDEIGKLSMAFDRMTERLKATMVSRDELARSEERYRTTMMSVGDGVIATDTEARVEMLNPVAEELTGWGQEEARNKPLEEVFRIINEETRQPVENPVCRVIREGLVVGLANHSLLIAKDGTERPIADSGAPIRDERNEVTGAVLVFRDQTPERAAFKALLESEEKYRSLFEDSRDAIYINRKSGELTDVNQTFVDLFGYTKEEMPGMNIIRIFNDPQDRPPIIEEIEKTGSVKDREVRFKKKDGTVLDVLLTVTAKKSDDEETVGYQGIIRDITAYKALESQLIQSQKLEAIGRLAGGIAHDFNNLLTTIIGNAEMALMDFGGQAPLREVLEDIKEAGARAAGLTRQLLAFSRKQILQPEVLNLNHVVGETDRMLRRLIGEDIDLEIILSPDLGRIESDVGQLEQILMNLAVNARDAMPKGGKLTIETKNVELDEAYAHRHIAVVPGPYVMLAVSDTGTGMTDEVQARIFEPFFTTKEKGKGTGLGLSTVYGIVKQSGGNIWVYSEPGKGATFKIYFPRVDAEVSGLKMVEAEKEGLCGTETVLVVEDDETVRNMAVKVLERYGYCALAAGGGEEAIRILQEHKGSIHIMLTDVVMPGMGVKDLTKRLSELRPDLKVLFMSGYTDNAIVHHGVLDKGIAFLQKPFIPVSLVRKVREVLDGEKP